MSAPKRSAFAFVPIALLALVSTAVAAQQYSRWPENIEALLFEYLTQIPGMTFPSLEVHCNQTTCVAAFITTGKGSALPSGEQLFPLYAKGWNVVSAGSGGSFDPATGESKGCVNFSNDTRPKNWLPL